MRDLADLLQRGQLGLQEHQLRTLIVLEDVHPTSQFFLQTVDLPGIVFVGLFDVRQKVLLPLIQFRPSIVQRLLTIQFGEKMCQTVDLIGQLIGANNVDFVVLENVFQTQPFRTVVTGDQCWFGTVAVMFTDDL